EPDRMQRKQQRDRVEHLHERHNVLLQPNVGRVKEAARCPHRPDDAQLVRGHGIPADAYVPAAWPVDSARDVELPARASVLVTDRESLYPSRRCRTYAPVIESLTA